MVADLFRPFFYRIRIAAERLNGLQLLALLFGLSFLFTRQLIAVERFLDSLQGFLNLFDLIGVAGDGFELIALLLDLGVELFFGVVGFSGDPIERLIRELARVVEMQREGN